MKKCCLIIPYFGKFPNYFELFLKTCQYNANFDWLIFTDDRTSYPYPGNVHVIYMTFSEICERIQSKFDFQINLDHPYKLCDFRPTYGYIFEDYLNDYAFWGECDVDTLMGDLNHFLPDKFMNEYDKIFCLGHLTIYRNTIGNNRTFMSSYHGFKVYRKFLSSPDSFAFDEEGNEGNINRIFKEGGKKVFEKDLSLNFEIRRTHFIRTIHIEGSNINGYSSFKHEKYVDALYLWNNGKIERYYKNNGNLIREEFPYMHLQKRNMKFNEKVLQLNCFKIVPNAFLPLEVHGSVTKANFSKIKKHRFCMHAWNVRWPVYKHRLMNLIK